MFKVKKKVLLLFATYLCSLVVYASTKSPTTVIRSTAPTTSDGLALDQNNETSTASRCDNMAIAPAEAAVRAHILRNYQKSVRPRKNSKEAVVVEIYVVVQRINKINEKDQEIFFTGYLAVQWFNEYFVWNDTEDLSCVESILLPTDEMWMPDLAITNSGNIYGLMMSPGHRVEVRSDGRCSFYPESTFNAFCNLQLTYFPYDDQLCTINVEGWLSTAKSQTFYVNKSQPPIHLIHWKENEQWVLTGIGTAQYKVKYEVDDTEYDRVEFRFYLQRKSAYYTTNVIIPSTIISCVELATFTLPTAEVLKMVISFTALLAYTVFQVMITDDMPRSSSHTPLLSVYIVLQMAYIGLALMGEGVIYLLIENVHREKPVPKWLDKTVRCIGCFLWLPPDGQYLNSTEQTSRWESSNQQAANLANDPGNIFTVADRLHAIQLNEFSRQQSDDFASLSVQPSGSGNNVDNGFIATNEITITLNNLDGERERRFHQRRVQLIVDETLARLKNSSVREVLRHQWLYIANVSKRFIFLIYLSCVTLTPMVMFLIMPLSKPDLCKTTVECF